VQFNKLKINKMKVALITGAGSRTGLGFETGRQLGEKGFHVILTARKAEQVEALAEELKNQGISASALKLDLLDGKSVEQAANAVKEQFGKLDVLINNAAVMTDHMANFEEKDLNLLSSEFETNIVGTWRVTQKFLPLLKESGHGRIVNVSSGTGSYGDPDYGLIDGFSEGVAKGMPVSAYAITKLALNGVTIKMAKELKQYNILVNSICPGMTATRPESAGFARPVEDGAKGIVWAATLPDDSPTGLFFRDRKPMPW